MSDQELVRLARRAEEMAADSRTPPAEVRLWEQIRAEISDWLSEPDEPGLFDE